LTRFFTRKISRKTKKEKAKGRGLEKKEKGIDEFEQVIARV